LQQATVGIKQVQDLAPRDRQGERGQAFQQGLMHFIERLMKCQPQMADQNHNIDAKRETR
jgi:hypothetical protein